MICFPRDAYFHSTARGSLFFPLLASLLVYYRMCCYFIYVLSLTTLTVTRNDGYSNQLV